MGTTCPTALTPVLQGLGASRAGIRFLFPERIAPRAYYWLTVSYCVFGHVPAPGTKTQYSLGDFCPSTSVVASARQCSNQTTPPRNMSLCERSLAWRVTPPLLEAWVLTFAIGWSVLTGAADRKGSAQFIKSSPATDGPAHYRCSATLGPHTLKLIYIRPRAPPPPKKSCPSLPSAANCWPVQRPSLPS